MRIDTAQAAMAAGVRPGANSTENIRGKEQPSKAPFSPKSVRPRNRDVYLPSEEESAGIYEIGFEDGRKVVGVNPFGGENPTDKLRKPTEDAPKEDGGKDIPSEEKSPEAKGNKSPKGPDKKKSPESEKEKSESCTGSTDKVDREIKALKEKIKTLKKQAEKAEGKERERLDKQLSALEAELARKDCDSYRRQHSEFR